MSQVLHDIKVLCWISADRLMCLAVTSRFHFIIYCFTTLTLIQGCWPSTGMLKKGSSLTNVDSIIIKQNEPFGKHSVRCDAGSCDNTLLKPYPGQQHSYFWITDTIIQLLNMVWGTLGWNGTWLPFGILVRCCNTYPTNVFPGTRMATTTDEQWHCER